MIAPGDRSVGHARFSRGFGIADFIADVDGLPGRNAAGLEDGAEFRRFAEYGGATGVMMDERSVCGTEDVADIFA